MDIVQNDTEGFTALTGRRNSVGQDNIASTTDKIGYPSLFLTPQDRFGHSSLSRSAFCIATSFKLFLLLLPSLSLLGYWHLEKPPHIEHIAG